MSLNGNNSTSHWLASLWGRLRQRDLDLAPYRRLALQLHYTLPRPDNPRSALLVTPTPSGLCAQGSVTLASCLGEQLQRPVLLIDVCPRAPEASRILDCSANRGLADILSNPKLPLDELVLPTTREHVFFLPAGTNVNDCARASPEDMSALLKAAETRYDFVLLSGGSVLNDPMALALAPFVGCVLLLVTENETPVGDLDAAQDALSFCKARKVGLVLTTPIRGSGSANQAAASANRPTESN